MRTLAAVGRGPLKAASLIHAGVSLYNHLPL